MAKKIDAKLILRLRDAGQSGRTIASGQHVSRRSVTEACEAADLLGLT